MLIETYASLCMNSLLHEIFYKHLISHDVFVNRTGKRIQKQRYFDKQKDRQIDSKVLVQKLSTPYPCHFCDHGAESLIVSVSSDFFHCLHFDFLRKRNRHRKRKSVCSHVLVENEM